MKHEQRFHAPIDGVIFKLGINENCPKIHCSILGPSNKQVGSLIIKKNVLSQLEFKNIIMAVLREKPMFRIQVGSKMGLRGWNSIKGILKYSEFQFTVDFSAHKNFDRIRLSDSGLREFMYGVDKSTSLRVLNIKDNNITSIGCEILKNYLPRTKINNLNISGNPIGNDGIFMISKLLVLPKYEMLELDISSCNFDQIGAKSIYTCLLKNCQLEVLHMNRNKLRGPTIRYFTEAMWKNKNLKKLSLESCELDHEASVRVLEALENNFYLKAVNLSHNGFTEKLSDSISQLFSSEN